MTEPERVAAGPFDDEPAGSVRLDQVPEGVVLAVAGALDLSLAPKVQRTVERAARLRPALLVIDLTEVTFLASAGMAELVRANRQLGGQVPVRVVATGRLVLRPLELTRLTDELTIHPTLADALAAG
ncbi:STAS domain-containing protein [Pseudonocardia halophobica]|uniref:Anti-anti-sigma factor n=1 Tax=Pseudonocardia halophobica TaxID=29401 RepID=A0A9W6UDE9_9PSEU|nr:STAS domain-containing protein [Pseudonocardia halophobica]GLL15695.1 anti-anti-sigma factor [Pseudonocardia halophobica]